MHIQIVKSSQIAAVGFRLYPLGGADPNGDDATGTLRIYFHRKEGQPSVYEYPNVQRGRFEALYMAESVGSYWIRNLKSVLTTFTRLAGDDETEALAELEVARKEHTEQTA